MARATARDDPAAMTSSAPATTPRRLLRSRDDKKLAGVCGGLARYFNVDPVLVRVVAVVLAAMGPGLVAYAAAWILIPSEDPGAEPAAAPTPAPPVAA